MKIKAGIAVIGIWILCVVAPLVGHHAFRVEFDPDKAVHLEGRITQVDWTNPHVYFTLAVPDGKGRTTDWRVELVSPNDLTTHKMTRLTLHPDVDVTVDGFAARNGDRLAGAMTFSLKATGQSFDISEDWKRWENPARK